MIWLQCSEEVFMAIGQRALEKGANVGMTEKQGEVFVIEYEEPMATQRTKRGDFILPSESEKWKREMNPDTGKMQKVRKTYKRYTGYIEMGHKGWYAVTIHPMLYNDLVAGIPLGPHVHVKGAVVTNVCVRHSEQYVYLDYDKDIVTNFTQHFEITL